ncbi:MAG: hypothetical protein U0836_26670 [Pirellulales bacterium]
MSDYTLVDGLLRITRDDGSTEVTRYSGDLPDTMANSPQSSDPTLASGFRGIVGSLGSSTDLNATYQNGDGQQAAQTLLGAVGHIVTGRVQGTGTLMRLGGNQC